MAPLRRLPDGPARAAELFERLGLRWPDVVAARSVRRVAGEVWTVGRGEHPERTPVYGGALMVGAMIVATVVTAVGVPAAVRVTVYLVSLVAAIAGFVLTFRDYG